MRLCGVKWAEQPALEFRCHPDTGVSYFDEYIAGFVLLRSDTYRANAIDDRCHGLDSINQQIDDHLLKLNAISPNQRQSG